MSIKFENVVLPSAEQWRAIILGARNPLNSWEKSDTGYVKDCSTCKYYDEDDNACRAEDWSGQPINTDNCYKFKIGPNDLDLMKRLRDAGTDHRKFMRMLPVIVIITAPLYWWKEFDTYKVGTVANSCSTMHKIHAKEFTLEDFSCEHLNDDCVACNVVFGDHSDYLTSLDILKYTIEGLNYWRRRYLTTKDKDDWWQMIQLLPSSYNQKRTVMMNYEVLANIYKSRKNHKLDEWSEHCVGDITKLKKVSGGDGMSVSAPKKVIGFCDWIKTLPYHEIITGEEY